MASLFICGCRTLDRDGTFSVYDASAAVAKASAYLQSDQVVKDAKEDGFGDGHAGRKYQADDLVATSLVYPLSQDAVDVTFLLLSSIQVEERTSKSVQRSHQKPSVSHKRRNTLHIKQPPSQYRKEHQFTI